MEGGRGNMQFSPLPSPRNGNLSLKNVFEKYSDLQNQLNRHNVQLGQQLLMIQRQQQTVINHSQAIAHLQNHFMNQQTTLSQYDDVFRHIDSLASNQNKTSGIYISTADKMVLPESKLQDEIDDADDDELAITGGLSLCVSGNEDFDYYDAQESSNATKRKFVPEDTDEPSTHKKQMTTWIDSSTECTEQKHFLQNLQNQNQQLRRVSQNLQQNTLNIAQTNFSTSNSSYSNPIPKSEDCPALEEESAPQDDKVELSKQTLKTVYHSSQRDEALSSSQVENGTEVESLVLLAEQQAQLALQIQELDNLIRADPESTKGRNGKVLTSINQMRSECSKPSIGHGK